ncbi:jg25613 [Pararge aegeria aegeria]|uniref:Jg25613 protein n=1 Tax=Pararge aegeria aegeria TaxID=348720 RepID=A0A8S4RA12_9NEOP|nr:jg25613 [Pararge aegeria aegeria]
MAHPMVNGKSLETIATIRRVLILEALGKMEARRVFQNLAVRIRNEDAVYRPRRDADPYGDSLFDSKTNELVFEIREFEKKLQLRCNKT